MYLLRVCIIPVVIILSVLTMHQNTFWRSEVALFERMDKYEPNFGRGQLLLAKAYYFAKRYDLAECSFCPRICNHERIRGQSHRRGAQTFLRRDLEKRSFLTGPALEESEQLPLPRKKYSGRDRHRPA